MNKYTSFMNSPLMLSVRHDRVEKHNMAMKAIPTAVSFGVTALVPAAARAYGAIASIVTTFFGGKSLLEADSPYEPIDK